MAKSNENQVGWTDCDLQKSAEMLRVKVEAALAMIILEVYQDKRLQCAPSAQRILDVIARHADGHIEGPQGSFVGIIERAIETDTGLK